MVYEQKGSFREHYCSGPHADFFREERHAPGTDTRLILVDQAGHQLSDPACSDLVMALTIAGRTPARWKAMGVWRETTARLPGAVGVSPMNERMEFDIPESHSLLICTISRDRVQAIDEAVKLDVYDMLNAAHHGYLYDHTISNFIREIWTQSSVQDAAAKLHIDGLTDALIASILRAVDRSIVPKTTSLVLSEKEVDRLSAYIRHNLSLRLTVDDMALMFSMTPWVFRRALHKSIGKSPYQLVQEIRVDMAKSLLISGQLTLTEIALQLGFSDHSHFTNTFRSKTGVTPSAFSNRS